MNSILGGCFIGLASVLLLGGTGNLAGISGITANAMRSKGIDRAWRVLFILGLLAGGLSYQLFTKQPLPVQMDVHGLWLIVAGLLVGVGTRMGNGCTSGHGICGISRGSRRSLLATIIFMATAMIVVYIRRHV